MVVAGCSLNCTISGWNNEQDSAGGQIEIERKTTVDVETLESADRFTAHVPASGRRTPYLS